jgi:hypothetical protein
MDWISWSPPSCSTSGVGRLALFGLGRVAINFKPLPFLATNFRSNQIERLSQCAIVFGGI